jgi:chorismate mutase
MYQQLNTIRRKIDDIDKELLQLLNERAKLARKLGVIKRSRGLAIQDHVRERAILARVRETNFVSLRPNNAIKIFEVIIRECRRLQEADATGISPSDDTTNELSSIRINPTEREVRIPATRDVCSGS